MNILVGKRLKTKRRILDLSQQSVADELNISQPAYARMEKGVTGSWVHHIDDLCKVLKLTRMEILTPDQITIKNINSDEFSGTVVQTGTSKIEVNRATLEECKAKIQEISDMLSSEINT